MRHLNQNAVDRIEMMRDAYLVAAAWSSTDDDDEPLDARGAPWSDDAQVTAYMVCRDFYHAQRHNLEAAMLADGYTWESAGHDLWLTRCGHGVGFWDRDLGDMGDRLTEASNALGEAWCYLGDDQQLHFA